MIKVKREKKIKYMKKIVILFILIIGTSSITLSAENCKDLAGHKKLGKGTIEYSKCIAKKSKEMGKKGLNKINTESKMTNWIKKKLNK